MERDLVILGSCVSRDPVTGTDLERRLKYYHCRSNLCSMASKSPLERPQSVEGLGSFQTRCVFDDLDKSINFDHENCFVVFDFIDDRFPVGRIGSSEFTYNFLVNKLTPKIFSGAEIIQHFRPENRALVRIAVESFAEAHEALFQKNKIILHECFLSPHYDGLAVDQRYVQLLNEHFEFLFSQLREVWKIDHILSSRAIVTSPEATPFDHQWGHTPFHFYEEYNSDIRKQLLDIMA